MRARLDGEPQPAQVLTLPAPTATVVVPTRGRADYLDVALASIAPQAKAAGAEILVIEDGGRAGLEVAERHGARWMGHSEPRGPNAARNTGIRAAASNRVVLTEDDVEAPPGWLQALLAASDVDPDVEVLGGPIRGRVEGVRWPMCGHEAPPISSFEPGSGDRDVDFVFAGNMLLRRSAIERVGPFAESLALFGNDEERRRLQAAKSGSAFEAGFYGDEEEWEDRYRAAGGRIRYVAAAGLDHRRAGPDARPVALMRAAYRRGRLSRRWAASRGRAPSIARELRVLAGAVWHVLRRRCANGLLWTAAAAGRLAEAASERRWRRSGERVPERPRDAEEPADDPYLAPGSGLVLGRRATARAALADGALDAWALASGQRWAVSRAAALAPARRRVLALGVERTGVPGLMATARAELERSRHDVTIAIAEAGDRGKFENLNALLDRHPAAGHDWLLVVDDDVALPAGFLDAFLCVAERLDFRLAQPAHRRRSHAAWPVTRRRPDVARRTQFVEIGPVTAFHRDTFAVLLPFPSLRMGWGLDAHWAAVAREHGWPIGIVDATPIRHDVRRTGSAYAHADAVAEARTYLAHRPYVTREEAARTLATLRRW
jgi:hypothetical protein